MKVNIHFQAQTASGIDRLTPQKYLQMCFVEGILELRRQSGHKSEKKILFPALNPTPNL
jgi:hypothetical protein